MCKKCLDILIGDYDILSESYSNINNILTEEINNLSIKKKLLNDHSS